MTGLLLGRGGDFMGRGDRAMFQMALPSDWIYQVQICLLRAGDSAAEDESPSD